MRQLYGLTAACATHSCCMLQIVGNSDTMDSDAIGNEVHGNNDGKRWCAVATTDQLSCCK